MIIVILTIYLILYKIDNGGTYSVPMPEYGKCSSDTLCYNMYHYINYILLLNQSDKLKLHHL